jgi:putative ABC transport system permease protein
VALWRAVARGLRALTHRSAADQDVTDEVEHYLEQATLAHMARGLSREDALRAARLDIGGVTRVREAVRTSGWEHAIETLLADLRYATRRLRAAPGFTAITVLTLALGIGATTAIFSVVDPVLFEPLPWPNADRAMTVWESNGKGDPYGRIGYATLQDMAQRVRSFEYVGAAGTGTGTLTGPAEPEPLVGQRVSWNYFRALGVQPALGRDVLPAEDVPNADRVILLANGLWRRRWGGDSTIAGRTIDLNGIPRTVVGVMPAGFQDPLQPDAQFWVPLRYDATVSSACRTCRHLRAVARLRSGATEAQADAELRTLFRNLKAEYSTGFLGSGLPVVSLRAYMVRDVRSMLLAVLGAVGFVLLIACVNVTNLLLAQGAQRQAEFAMRTALGASPGRIRRQVLTESLLLALVGGAAGVGVAVLGMPALLSLAPNGLPLAERIALNPTALGFALLLTTLVGVAFGATPAFSAARSDLALSMKGAGSRTAGVPRATRASLVVSEVALALVLLVGAGLMLQSLRRLFSLAPGFEPANVLTMQVQTAGPRFATNEATWSYFDQVLSAVRAVPGVESAALTSQLPLSGDMDQYGVHAEPVAGEDLEIEHPGYRYGVSDGYLETLRIRLLRGRALTAADRAGSSPVAMIDETMAKHGWGGADPIGHRVRIGPADQGPWYTIVGVVSDVMQSSLGERAANAIYVPESQWLFADGAMSLVVRTRAGTAATAATARPAALTRAVRAAIWSVDKDQAIVRIATLSDLVAATEARRRFALVLFEVFAAVALLLATAGIYGVLAGSVTERSKEIGVRAALGASRAQIVKMILRQGAGMTTLGIGLGLLAAAGLSRAIAGLLFDTSRLDPVTYVGVIALLVIVSVVACSVPAWRAARVDPALTLRAE